ncbi:MAG: alpha/beta hydrolase [Verrucomicrobia bacterium]|nr:alpha/beta hydrolase [Verrucomicrobiota bacterium]
MKYPEQNPMIPSRRRSSRLLALCTATLLTLTFAVAPLRAAGTPEASIVSDQPVRYQTAKLSGLDIFYREAGPKDAPTILLLHGFPTSSNMFRHLIPRLAATYHVVAPDYPGYGQSSMPDRKDFAYTFENCAKLMDQLMDRLGIQRYSMYVMDYGAPIGYRLALMHPERVQALIIQNGNAYDEGLLEFWDPIKKYWKEASPANRQALHFLVEPKATKWQYENGVSDLSLLDPTTWALDQLGMDRPGNDEVQLDMFYDYRTNVPLYPAFQAFFRKYQPPTLIVWGKNDYIFPPAGAAPYKRDLKTVETHLLDTGHFALETHGIEMATLIKKFLKAHPPAR